MRLYLSLVLTTLVASAFTQEVPNEFPNAAIEAVNELPNVDMQMVDENTFSVGDVAEETAAVVDPSSVIVSAINDAVETVAESLTFDAPVVEEVSEIDETPIEEDEPMLQPVAVETAAPDPAEMEDDEPALDLGETMQTDAEPEPEPAPTDSSGDAMFDVEKVEEPEAIEPMEEVIVEVEEPRKPTKKELKAVDKFNTAVDNIANILSERLSGENDTLPLEVDEEVLEELEQEVTTLPPPTTTEATPAEPECPAKWADKCLGEKCKGKAKCVEKCAKKGCATEKKNKKKNKNNKNKKNKRKEDDKNKKNKKSNKNNKNKNNKKNKNKNKNIRSKLFRTRGGSKRQSKDLDFDELDDEDELEQGRRMVEGSTQRRKNKKKNNKNRSNMLEAEARDKYVPKSAESGPMFASDDELIASSAKLMGFSHVRRAGDVKVDMSGKHTKFVATVVLGPLNVIPTSPARMLRRSEVTTELRATMHFTAKETRRRDKLSINEVVVEVPVVENVSVMRSDLVLEPEVISAAKDEVISAIDTDRLARIIHATLAAAFDEDNIMQNLEDHPALKA